jgi:short-subunit dehydrogenase
MNDYKSALITGATSGIGRAFARLLPPTISLLLTGRNVQQLSRLAEDLSSGDRTVRTVSADLATAEGRGHVIKAAQECSVDLLISNAGNGFAGLFGTTPVAAEQDSLSVNVIATVELLRALIPPMIENAKREGDRCGVIVVSSRGGFRACPKLASYGASKAFQLRLVESIASERRDEPIDLLALCPTYTDTNFFERAGLPAPPKWVSAETAAREGLSALGHRVTHICYGPWERPIVLRRTLSAVRQVLSGHA